MDKEVVKVKIKLTLRYYLCIAKCKLLAIFSESKANEYFDELTIDMNVNNQKYFKTVKV